MRNLEVGIRNSEFGMPPARPHPYINVSVAHRPDAGCLMLDPILKVDQGPPYLGTSIFWGS